MNAKMFLKLKNRLQATRVIKSIEFQFAEVAALFTNKTMHHCMLSPIPGGWRLSSNISLKNCRRRCALLAGWANL